MAIAAFNKVSLFTSKLDCNLRKKPVKCYIWSIALCSAGTGHCGKCIRNTWKSYEMWCWRRMERISWANRVRNEEVLQSKSSGTFYIQ
jgi:hypothetical protein